MLTFSNKSLKQWHHLSTFFPWLHLQHIKNTINSNQKSHYEYAKKGGEIRGTTCFTRSLYSFPAISAAYDDMTSFWRISCGWKLTQNWRLSLSEVPETGPRPLSKPCLFWAVSHPACFSGSRPLVKHLTRTSAAIWWCCCRVSRQLAALPAQCCWQSGLLNTWICW